LPAAAAKLLIDQRFIRLREEQVGGQTVCRLEGPLVEKLAVWLSLEKHPATLDDLGRFRAAVRRWAGV